MRLDNDKSTVNQKKNSKDKQCQGGNCDRNPILRHSSTNNPGHKVSLYVGFSNAISGLSMRAETELGIGL